MNYTTNLHLPQWQATDRIHHDDFNDAFSKIDTAVAAAGNCHVEKKTYTGDGRYSNSDYIRNLTFSHAPFAVILASPSNGFAVLIGQCDHGYAHAPMSSSSISDMPMTVGWSNGGKTVSWYSDYPNTAMNVSGVTYTAYALYMV